MSRRRSRSVITGVAAVLAAGLVAGGVALTAQRGADDPVLDAAPTVSAPATTAGDGTVVIERQGADLPGGDVLDRCDTSSRATVASYDTTALGAVVLQCGTSAQGYEHIRQRHEGDWDEVVTGHGSRDWDDAMLTAVRTALSSPRSGYPQDVGDGKVCFAAALRFDDGSRPAREPFVRVIVSATTERVITAYPTRDDGCA